VRNDDDLGALGADRPDLVADRRVEIGAVARP
jgi:hypothetical protein